MLQGLLQGSQGALCALEMSAGLAQGRGRGETPGGPVDGGHQPLHLGPVTGVLGPLILQFSLVGVVFDGYGYTTLQVTNPFWTFFEVFDGDVWVPVFANGWSIVVVGLCGAAALMLVTNLVMLARDLLPDRTAVPQRVEAEWFDAAAQPNLPTSPWDLDDGVES